MDVSKIVAEIDAKIVSLQQARAVLVGLDETSVITKPRRGRPKGSTNAAKKAAAKPAKRNMSKEGRTRLSESMKRRWAERKKAMEKAPPKGTPSKT